LPPIIQSRTRQQAKETGENLVTGAEPIKNVTKKQRKFRNKITDPTAQERGRRKLEKAQEQTEE
jgi:hypothetical protein